jgi:KipI family sensor histidine kinase inhibitor
MRNDTPLILPLGDRAMVVRFAEVLSLAANSQALGLARVLNTDPIAGVAEIAPGLASVLLRYEPRTIGFDRLAGEVRLRLSGAERVALPEPRQLSAAIRFDGPDLPAVLSALGLDQATFIGLHNRAELTVLATGFAPGFIYCGLHPEALHMPRRSTVRPSVPAGTVLFAAGQTAVTATTIPTGWSVIGTTSFTNFDPTRADPLTLHAGDRIRFTEAA